MAPNRRQGIIWTNTDPIPWRIYAALGGDGFFYNDYTMGADDLATQGNEESAAKVLVQVSKNISVSTREGLSTIDYNNKAVSSLSLVMQDRILPNLIETYIHVLLSWS